MSLWSPTHVQFTVLRARNLIAKGKGGNNDVFVTIQLGKEKYQTSTIKNALNPEWFEECDLPIHSMRSEIEVSLFHRGVLSDDFLGCTAIPLWEHKITESSKSSWLTLHNKPSKSDNKYRGELEVKLKFHCQGRPDAMSHGLKKKTPSLRNLTSAFGEKFKFTRSRSFRENRQDSGPGKMDKSFAGRESDTSNDLRENALTRSYSMSAAYIRSLSQERSKMASHPTTSSGNNFSNSSVGSEIYSQSLYNLPGSRRSCTDVVFHQLPPPPYDLKVTSRDDSAVLLSGDIRGASGHQTNPTLHISLPPNSGHFESARRELPGIYESIKERTEPENSVSSSSDPESVPVPKPRGKRFPPKNLLSPGTKIQENIKECMPLSGGRTNTADQQPFNGRDSGIIEDRSSSLGNSIEGSLATTDGTNNGSRTRGQTGSVDSVDPPRLEVPVSNTRGEKGLLYHLDREMSLNTSSRSKKKGSAAPSQFYSKENSRGELVVRKRTRGQRDRNRERIRQARQAGNRRFLSQERDQGASGLYDDSLSEHSDSSQNDVPDDMLSSFKNMNKEELLRQMITSKAQMIRKDQYIRDLENYIDELLVRVMETTPRLLIRQQFHRL